MPNWCSSTVTITAPPGEINKLLIEFHQAKRKAQIETDFGDTWLGHLLDYIGEWDEEKGEGSCKCRGWITFQDSTNNEITLDIESAWSPHLGPIKRFCDKFAPSAEIVYTATEPGCCIYETNDPAVVDKYLVDIWDDGCLPKAFDGLSYEELTEDELKHLLMKALRYRKDRQVGELIAAASEKWNGISINQFKWCDLEEVC